MTLWYYQIKEKNTFDEHSNWIWPPLFSGKVEADTKKEARAKIEEDYRRQFPLRVKSADLHKEDYLLSITEIKDFDTRTKGLFEPKECKYCGAGFTVIGHYNNHNQRYKGSEVCSDECDAKLRGRNDEMRFFERDSKNPAVIYKIKNIKTNQVYIGQTTQAFTLRWWQHLKSTSDNKFHNAIKSSRLSDWRFSVLEVVDYNSEETERSLKSVLGEREQFWIGKYNSIEGGYNSATACADSIMMPLFDNSPTPAPEVNNG